LQTDILDIIQSATESQSKKEKKEFDQVKESGISMGVEFGRETGE
jgi:hypothetical protein